jgi:hypothetical protein
LTPTPTPTLTPTPTPTSVIPQILGIATGDIDDDIGSNMVLSLIFGMGAIGLYFVLGRKKKQASYIKDLNFIK